MMEAMAVNMNTRGNSACDTAVLFTMNALENGIIRNPPTLRSPVAINGFRYCIGASVFFRWPKRECLSPAAADRCMSIGRIQRTIASPTQVLIAAIRRNGACQPGTLAG